MYVDFGLPHLILFTTAGVVLKMEHTLQRTCVVHVFKPLKSPQGQHLYGIDKFELSLF